MDRNPTWIVLAQVLRPQGRKGEVLADLLTDYGPDGTTLDLGADKHGDG